MVDKEKNVLLKGCLAPQLKDLLSFLEQHLSFEIYISKAMKETAERAKAEVRVNQECVQSGLSFTVLSGLSLFFIFCTNLSFLFFFLLSYALLSSVAHVMK